MTALAACDQVKSVLPTIDVAAQPIFAPSDAMPPQPAPPVPGHAVATMPRSRQGSGLTQPIVVRGQDAPGPLASTSDPGGKPGDITLNFAGADIRDVINSVLGETLKLNYVIDPEVAGPVTFNVSRPISREEALSTLEAVLNSRGATMVQVDGIIRVMPLRRDGKAATTAAPIDRGPAAKAVGERTEVFPLRYVGAADMQHMLEKVLPPGQVVAADDKRHVLMVQGTPSELQLAEDTVRIFDIDQMSGMSMALVPLHNADPAAIADELRNIFAATRKEADADAIRFVAVTRLNAVMVITRSNRYLDEARDWIARLDRVHDLNERRVYVYNLQYSKAVQVGQKLQGLLTGMDIQFRAPGGAATGDGLGAGDAGAKPDAAKPPPLPISTDALPQAAPAPPADAAAAPPAAAAAAAAPATPPPQTGVRIEADEAHNALLISANARDYELIRQVLAGLDVPPLQVLIEVTVAEVVLNDNLNYGVEYFIKQGNASALLTTSNIPAIAPVVPGFNLAWVVGNFEPRAILDLLSSVTQTKVISTPRLLVLSNQTARLQVGDVVPIITQSATSTVTSNPLVLNNVTYKETGVVLEVTPRVNSGGYVTMDVNQSVSDVVNTTTSQIDSPTIRQRRLTSTVSVKSGESILLGGLIQQTDNRSNSGIPVLHELPGIGSLFGSRTNAVARTELIMLMTPHVIANDSDARDITARVERQFQAVLDAGTLAQPRVPAR
jgi:general secretion pathway protein D